MADAFLHFGPTPTPASKLTPPAPASGSSFTRRLLLGCAGVLAVALLIGATVGGGLLFRHLSAPETPDNAFAAAVKTYRQHQPTLFRKAESQVRSGQLKTKADVTGFLAANAKDVGTALDEAFKPLIDDKGKITDPDKAADVLGEAAAALGAK